MHRPRRIPNAGMFSPQIANDYENLLMGLQFKTIIEVTISVKVQVLLYMGVFQKWSHQHKKFQNDQ